jgi:hypothetical protein
MKKRKMKKQINKEMKNTNLTEKDFYKKHYIECEFIRLMKEILKKDEELFSYIKLVLKFKMIEDFSNYGNKLIDLDFTDYIKGERCFFCFIDFNLEDFLETMDLHFRLLD